MDESVKRVGRAAMTFQARAINRDAAFEDEAQAKCLLLTDLLKVVKPVLQDASSAILKGESIRLRDYGHQTPPDADWHVDRGILLAGYGRAKTNRPPLGNLVLRSETLYLLETGEFARVIAMGRNEATDQADWVTWTSDLRVLKIEEVIDEGWNVREIAARLSDELDAQSVGMTKVTSDAHVAARTIGAVAVLLEGLR